MSGLFTVIPDAFAVVSKGGVFRQVRLYHRRGRLYAGAAGGFVGLMNSGATTVPSLRIDELLLPEADFPGIARTGTGRLYLADTKGLELSAASRIEAMTQKQIEG